jgi:trehalose 6-phosphate synthase
MCPWADPGYFQMLPRAVARRLVDGMLGADILAFLAPRWADNFLRCCSLLGYEVDDRSATVRHATGVATVRVYPVGVDVAELRNRSAQPGVRTEMRRVHELVGERQLIVRVERMEPAKNILRGLAAFAEFLTTHPEQVGHVVHYVLAYASRTELAAYQRYADEVHAAVVEINKRFGTPEWCPVVLDTGNNFERGLALMACADVVVVNPLRDGMNLVAKECPSVSERDGVVIGDPLRGHHAP